MMCKVSLKKIEESGKVKDKYKSDRPTKLLTVGEQYLKGMKKSSWPFS